MAKRRVELLKTKNLSIHFKRDGKLFKAIDDVDFTVYKGEIVGVVGESGSGKTTLGRALIGLLSHTTGEVIIDGKKIPSKKIKFVNKDNKWIFEKVQMIYQDPASSLNEVKKISEILSEGILNFNILKKERNIKLEELKKKLEVHENKLSYVQDSNKFIEKEINKEIIEVNKKEKENLIKKNKRLVNSINKLKKLKQLKEKIDELNREFYSYKEKAERKINVLKEENISNVLTFRDIKNADDLELTTVKKDEKIELKIKKLEDPKKTKAFKTITNLISKAIEINFNEVREKNRDLIIFIKKLRQSAKKESNVKLRNMIYVKINHLYYEKKIIENLENIYINLKEKHMVLIRNHTKDNLNEYYNYLLKQNEIMRNIKDSLNEWKYREEIKRAKKVLQIEKNVYREKIKKLQKKYRKDKREKSKLEKDYDKEMWIIKEKLKNNEKKILAKAKSNIAGEIRNFPEKWRNAEQLEETIHKLKDQINLIKSSLNYKNKKNVLDEKLYYVLEKIGLSAGDLNKYPSQFSGGQKQRIGIARSVFAKPELIIADEPISALDVSLQAGVVNLLKDLQKEYKMSIVFIAHDLEMINYVADRIAVVYKGKIVEMGPAKSVYKNPVHPYTKALINAQPSIKKIGAKLKTAEYDPLSHNYNEYKFIEEFEVKKGHYVLGTKEEIKRWKQEAR